MKIKPTPYQVQVKIFEKAGCVYSRTKGDHLIFHYHGAIRPVIIPKYKEVPAFIIKNNMRIIGLSREKYFNFLLKD
ncbi:MAG: type II toxin-antitoxin system HicA family toxin [Desulfobulbaceae bacterium]|nr:type II toxin-antitoxin system HicA family toxin [Desulfobulbaceae bacterium]